MPKQLNIIAESNDSVSRALGDVALAAGRTVRFCSLFEAASSFSISVSGAQCEVIPEVPTFLRFTKPLDSDAGSDDQFLQGECIATLWAGLALSRNKVVNRPSSLGLFGDWSRSTAVCRSRILMEKIPESFSKNAVDNTRLPKPDARTIDWWIEDLGSLQVSKFPRYPVGRGPYHFRTVSSNSRIFWVVVAGEQTFHDPVPFGVGEDSANVTRLLGLNFAALAWEVDEQSELPLLVYIDAHPGVRHIAFNQNKILQALIDYLD